MHVAEIARLVFNLEAQDTEESLNNKKERG